MSMSRGQGDPSLIKVAELGFTPQQSSNPISFVGKHSGKQLAGFDFIFQGWGPSEQQKIESMFDEGTATVTDPIAGRTYQATVHMVSSSYTQGQPIKTYTGEFREIDLVPHVEEIEIEGHRFPVITYIETEASADDIGREAILKLTEDEFHQFNDLVKLDPITVQRIGVDEKPLTLRFGGAFYWSSHEDENGQPYYKQIVRFLPVDFPGSSPIHILVPLTYYDALTGMVVRLTERFEALLNDLTEKETITAERRDTILNTYDGSLVSEDRGKTIASELTWVPDAEDVLG